ncbi:MAG: hypothetical protein ACPIOQ_60940, partial [Promethearchaeia archaeon]
MRHSNQRTQVRLRRHRAKNRRRRRRIIKRPEGVHEQELLQAGIVAGVGGEEPSVWRVNSRAHRVQQRFRSVVKLASQKIFLRLYHSAVV